VVDKTWIPDLPKGSDNYRFGWIRDTPVRLQIQRYEPCNLSTTNPLVINLAAAQLTSLRRLTLACESKNTSKCTEKQPNHGKALDSTPEWGSTTEERRPVLDRNELSKTPTLEEGGGGCIRGVWGRPRPPGRNPSGPR
jgi:hypothetical protein